MEEEDEPAFEHKLVESIAREDGRTADGAIDNVVANGGKRNGANAATAKDVEEEGEVGSGSKVEERPALKRYDTDEVAT